jgi:hypothetical protein
MQDMLWSTLECCSTLTKRWARAFATSGSSRPCSHSHRKDSRGFLHANTYPVNTAHEHVADKRLVQVLLIHTHNQATTKQIPRDLGDMSASWMGLQCWCLVIARIPQPDDACSVDACSVDACSVDACSVDERFYSQVGQCRVTILEKSRGTCMSMQILRSQQLESIAIISNRIHEQVVVVIVAVV